MVDEDGVVEITQPYEHHPALQQMLELPKPMAVLEALLGEPIRSLRHVHGDRVVHRQLDETGGAEGDVCGDGAHLFYSTNGHVLPPGVECDLRWHADGDFLRYTYLIEDLGAAPSHVISATEAVCCVLTGRQPSACCILSSARRWWHAVYPWYTSGPTAGR